MASRATSEGNGSHTKEPLLGSEPDRAPQRRGSGAMSPGGSIDHQEGRWIGGAPRTSPSLLAGAAAAVPAGYGYGEELHRAHLHAMMKRTQSSAAMREARARRTAWIVIEIDGKRSFLQADKRSITQRLGLNIPIRDLRLMDFNLLTSDTGSILVRDNAIMFTMEHVRLIITSDKVLIPREGYEHNLMANRFVDVLEEAVADWARQQQQYKEQLAAVGEHSDFEEDGAGPLKGVPVPEAVEIPFELVALEAALKEVVNASALQVKELEGVALPALDALTKSVSTSNLERVRKVKTRHQRLVIRVETLRDELQRFLHDDDDMIKMCLTRKKELEALYAEAAAQAATAAAASMGPGSLSMGGLSMSLPHVGSMRGRSPLTAIMMQQHQQQLQLMGSPTATTTPARDTFTAGAALPAQLQAGPSDEEYEEDAEDVENLLESYFAQVDGLWDKLVSIGEYIKDTEEYINIELDAGRNRLIRLDIILTAASFAIAPFNLVAGILGENLVIPTFLNQSVKGFYMLNSIALITVLTLFYSIILYMRHRKLI